MQNKIQQLFNIDTVDKLCYEKDFIKFYANDFTIAGWITRKEPHKGIHVLINKKEDLIDIDSVLNKHYADSMEATTETSDSTS